MLGLDFVKANRDTVERAIRDKGLDLDLRKLLELQEETRGLKGRIDALRASRNAISDKFRQSPVSEQASLREQVKGIAQEIQEAEVELHPLVADRAFDRLAIGFDEVEAQHCRQLRD